MEEALLKVTKEISGKLYDDALSPGMKEVGKIGDDVAKTARLILAPIQITAHLQRKLEKFLNKIEQRIPPENRIEPNLQIAVPIVESMRYVEENQPLWEMFGELLAKSMDKTQISKVHPAFAHIVKTLTPDEAYMLKKLEESDFMITDVLSLNRKLNRFENRVEESSSIPLGDLISPDSINIYYAHLESLSLVAWPVDDQKPIMSGDVQTGVRSKSRITLTEFGKLFIEACKAPIDI